jgi:VWFA-related protein
MRLRASAILLLLTLTVIAARAQQNPIDTPIFRSSVDAVEIDAFVLDAMGNPVTDLTLEDFEILEDGKPQDIVSFALVDIPIERIERTAPGAVSSDVRTNQRPEGRVYLFAVDEIPGSSVPRLRHHLRQFVEQYFGPNDTAAIVYVGRGRSTDGQDFTSDRTLLLKSIDRLSAGFGGGDLEQSTSRDAATAVPTLNPDGTPISTVSNDFAGVTNVMAPFETEFLLRSRMLSLRTLAEFMGNMRGRRKSIIYVTNGLGTSVYEALDYVGGTRSLAVEDLHGAITAATRGNVSIYPLDPSGLNPGRDVTEEGPVESENANPAASQTQIGRMQDLRSLAETTGGFAIINTNNFDGAFTQIVRENSSYYVLAFSTRTSAADGRFHEITVRVKRPGVQVRSRGGYLAPLHRKTPLITRASTLTSAVADALRSPVAVSSVPIRVFAAPYRGIAGNAKVAVAAEFGVEALNLSEMGGRFVGDLAIALRPTSAEGKLLEGQRHELALALKPETFALTKARGVRVVTELALAPGRYQLRVAGGPTVGAAGSVTYDLEIPDFANEPLSMSGVALTSSAAEETATVWPGTARPLDAHLPTPITAGREFDSTETVTVYAEVYENAKRPPHTINFKADLRSTGGRTVSTVAAQRASNAANASSGGYGFTTSIKLENVDPGSYVLHVEATSSAAPNAVVSRDIPIRVR